MSGWLAWTAGLAVLALAPLLLTMGTSFVKLVVVGSLVRNALGTPQIPPNIVITGLAMVLSVHVMWPVAAEIRARYENPDAAAPTPDPNALAPDASPEVRENLQRLARFGRAAHEPLHRFLARNASAADQQMFRELHAQLNRAATAAPTSAPAPAAALDLPPGVAEDLAILVPAFVLTELTRAFQIGLLILIPFLIVDLFVSNVLLALGAQMLQPSVVSLPLKILLFVLADGWRLIIKGVILGYVH